jgi:methylmalonyl-CoA mutase
MIFFRLSADADQFLTMAKFRALRKLWARVEEAAGLAPQPAFISAETAWRMMTRRDPYVNMLRVTIAAFAAGLGGANAVTVLPFTSALGLPDSFARRIARNTQLLLLEESNVAKVADPAAGSGGIEALTEELCRTAWALFQEIEKAGGAAAALESGLIQSKVAELRTAREKAVATRKDPLTGTSEFPFLGEAPVSVLIPAPAKQASIAGNALPCIRLAEPYEALRDASDDILQETGARPKVFLATLGKPADHIARATFAKNFFEAGGIEAVEFSGNDLAAAFKTSGASLVCLCSSDDLYAREAADAARALKAAGAKHLYLAGRPGDLAQVLEQAGVETYIFAGCDALATLKQAQAMLQGA